jgi:hypothetical protein
MDICKLKLNPGGRGAGHADSKASVMDVTWNPYDLEFHYPKQVSLFRVLLLQTKIILDCVETWPI